MFATRKYVFIALSTATVLAVCILLFLPWLTIPSGADLLGESRDSYGVFRLPAVIKIGEGSGLIANLSSLSTNAPILIIGACVILAMLGVYIVLALLTKRRAAVFGFTGFICAIILSIFFMDTLNTGNSQSAYAGPGLFAARFLTITPYPFILLAFAVFGAVIVVPLLGEYLRRVQSTELELELQRANLTFKERFRLNWRFFFRDILRDKYLYLMLAPMMAYYVIFYFLPYSGLRLAFMDFRPLLGFENSPWVGMKHFIDFFTGPFFWRLLRNTLLLGLYGLFWSFPVPIILAILFNELRFKRFRTIVQSITYIPRFISVVVVAGMVINLLTPSGGLVNNLLLNFGIIDKPIYFIMMPEYFRTIYISQGIWMWAGFNSIIYYSSICAIDEELYEAAKIDGASRFNQIRYILIPSLYPTMAIMLILAIGNIIATNLEQILLLSRPATYDVSDVILSYVFRVGLAQASPNYSFATAVGLFNGVIALILVTSANKISKKIGDVGLF